MVTISVEIAYRKLLIYNRVGGERTDVAGK
jgi:hypothetical protein